MKFPLWPNTVGTHNHWFADLCTLTCTNMCKKLLELTSLAIGSQDAGFKQPLMKKNGLHISCYLWFFPRWSKTTKCSFRQKKLDGLWRKEKKMAAEISEPVGLGVYKKPRLGESAWGGEAGASETLRLKGGEFHRVARFYNYNQCCNYRGWLLLNTYLKKLG